MAFWGGLLVGAFDLVSSLIKKPSAPEPLPEETRKVRNTLEDDDDDTLEDDDDDTLEDDDDDTLEDDDD
ncbi:hypothetical protein DSO57_1010888 [Entomophthora muscae]|uniref:Uncharacterized protein n=1 Tax=Entomophthora muscae TaxID=34485 RepID=A0ACC2T6A1_9FUNG|nr:hypothetical protein DSO57_1010888 [Entomophthora muscae]